MIVSAWIAAAMSASVTTAMLVPSSSTITTECTRCAAITRAAVSPDASAWQVNTPECIALSTRIEESCGVSIVSVTSSPLAPMIVARERAGIRWSADRSCGELRTSPASDRRGTVGCAAVRL
jgi:hypothetical protein